MIAKVIACLFTSSVGFPDFILRGEVRGHLDRNGHGKDLLARTEAFVHVLQLPRQMQVPCFGNAVIRKEVNGAITRLIAWGRKTYVGEDPKGSARKRTD